MRQRVRGGWQGAMMEGGSYRGAFHPIPIPGVTSLSLAHTQARQMQPFALRPEHTSFSVFEGMTTHAMPAQGTMWTQHVAETPVHKLSTRYEKLFTSMSSVTNLTRANKTIVSGSGPLADTKPLQSAQTAATLLRINETTTAFGPESIGVPTHDVGAGIMAEALAQKWSAKNEGRPLGTKGLLTKLEQKYRQLDSVEKMREQSATAVLEQVDTSRTDAARHAAARGKIKNVKDVDAYVSAKFAKHGLGPVPDGVLAPAPQQSFGGGFHPFEPKRVKRLTSIQNAAWDSQPFVVRPGASSSRVYEGSTTQIAPKQETSWTQHIATPSETMSTAYENLFPALHSASDLGRANKALVRGGSDMLSPTPGKNMWRGKEYSPEAQLTATLLRVNETTTAFGNEALRSPTHDVGAGIMAEAMAKKWSARQQGSTMDMAALGKHLTATFPQLHSVDKMRTQGAEALVAQVAKSRMDAAVMAAQRGQAKGKSDLGEYVQRKFNKHGLGQLPAGWAAKAKGQ